MVEPQPRISAVRRLAFRLSEPSGIALLFIVGFAIRIVLARGGGFPYDMDSFSAWAGRLADKGPWNFYPRGGEEFFVDYPPGYLYVLFVVGRVARILGEAPGVFLLKLPPILGDLGLAWLVMRLAERLAPSGAARRLPVRGLAAAAILLNPAIFFISAVWGQVDVFLALPVVGALLLLGTEAPSFRREAGGVALLAIAVGTKPQGAFLLPIVALLLYWRHVRSGMSAARDPDARRRAALEGLGRLGALAGVGVAAGFALLAPFRLGPVQAWDFYSKAAQTYKITSVFAFNFWGVLGFWKPDSGSDAFEILGLPALYWGLALFMAGTAAVIFRAWSALKRGEDEGRVLAFGSLALTLVGFAVLTRIHERYLFLPLALAATLIGIRWIRRAFIGLSVAYFVNAYFPFVYYLDFVGRPAPTLGGLADVLYGFKPGGTDTSDFRFRLLSAAVTALCLYIAWFGWRGLQKASEGAAASVAAGEVETPARDYVADALAVADRSGPWVLRLHPVGGRAALIALAIFALALVGRLLGLGHPPGMYFDEVYHARAGAEYIAHKEVFEFTHPPFAKEMQALSINYLAGFNSREGEGLPGGYASVAITPRPGGVIAAEETADGSVLRKSKIDGDCGLVAGNRVFESDIRPAALVADNNVAYLAGVTGVGNVLARIDGGRADVAVAVAGTRA